MVWCLCTFHDVFCTNCSICLPFPKEEDTYYWITDLPLCCESINCFVPESVCVCVCVGKYVRMWFFFFFFVCVCVCGHVCMCVYTCVYACVCTYVHVCGVCVCACVCVCVCACVCLCCTFVYLRFITHAYMHSCLHV